MPLNGNALGTAIKNQLIADGKAVDGPDIEALWQSVGSAVVAYLIANTVVTTTVAAPIPVTVVVATGIGGTTAPGAGTGTIS